MTALLHSSAVILVIMSLIIFALTQVIKTPYKMLTKKLFNEKGRKLANTAILLIPFGLGILADFIYAKYCIHIPFDAVRGLSYGTGSVSVYGVINQFLNKKIENPYTETEEGKKVLEAVETVKEQPNTENAQEQLEKLLKG